MLDMFLFICEVVILGLDDLLSSLGPVLRGLLIAIPLVLIALGVPMRILRCVLAAVGHVIKIGGLSARTMAIPLILFCRLSFVTVGLVSAKCVSSGTTMICGDGGICDMDDLANTEHLYLNGKVNNPTSEAVLRYMPKLKFVKCQDEFTCPPLIVESGECPCLAHTDPCPPCGSVEGHVHVAVGYLDDLRQDVADCLNDLDIYHASNLVLISIAALSLAHSLLRIPSVWAGIQRLFGRLHVVGTPAPTVPAVESVAIKTEKPDAPGPVTSRTVGTQVEIDLDEEDANSVEVFDGSDAETDITNRSDFITIDDEIDHPNQPVAIFIPATVPAAKLEDEDGTPRRAIMARPRAPLTRNELQRRMPPGTRFYLRKFRAEPAGLKDAFGHLDLVITEQILALGLDLADNSAEVHLVRDREAAQRAAKRAAERAAVEKLAQVEGVRIPKDAHVIEIPLDDSFGTPPTTPEPGDPANPEAGCALI